MNIAPRDVKQTGKRFLQECRDDDVTGLAAELAYRFFLALFPFLLFLATLGGLTARAMGVDNPSAEFLDLFGEALPPDAASVVRTQVTEVVDGSNAGFLSISILAALWAASSGMGSLMKAINRAYDVPESRRFWKKTAISLGTTLLGGAAIVAAILVTVVGQVALGRIADEAGVGSAAEWAMQIGRWPLAFALTLVATAFVYWAAPNHGLPFKWVTPGAVAFALGWTVVTVGFAIYVANLSSYNATYGTLGGVVVLLLWFYLTSLVLLAGAELNAVLDDQRLRSTLAERRAEVERELLAQGKRPPAVDAEARNWSAPAGVAPPVALAEGGPPAPVPVRDRHGPGISRSSLLAIAGAIIAAIAWRKFTRSAR